MNPERFNDAARHPRAVIEVPSEAADAIWPGHVFSPPAVTICGRVWKVLQAALLPKPVPWVMPKLEEEKESRASPALLVLDSFQVSCALSAQVISSESPAAERTNAPERSTYCFAG